MSTTATRPGPFRDRMLVALVVLSAALRVLPALRPLLVIDDLAIPDDAYLSLTIARSIARGLGPWCGLGPTNGFQPLFVFLMAPVFALIRHDAELPVRIAILLLVACDTIALVLLVRLLARFAVRRSVLRIAALAWALDPYAILTSLNALETSLAFLLTLVAFGAFHALSGDGGTALAGPPFTARRSLGLGALIGLAGLARIDNLLLLVALGLPVALAPAPRRLRALGGLAAGTLLVQLPWLLYSWHATGLLFPVSGRAVRFESLSEVGHAPGWSSFYAPMLGRAIRVVASKNPVYLALIAGLAACLPFAGHAAEARRLRDRLAPIAPLAGFGALLFAAYTGVIFGYWHFARYFFVLALPLVLAMALLLDECLARFRGPRARGGLLAAVTFAVIAGSVLQPSFRRLYTPGATRPWGYMRIGLWARSHFPRGTVIGGSQTGALGYFADDLTVVNLDGVVNQAAFEALRAKRAMDYVRAAGVRDLVWQDDIEFLARESRDLRPGEITLVETLAGFRTLNTDWHHYRVQPPAAAGPPP